MATKEANVYIIDVGRSMGQHRNGRKQTDLEWAMSWVWDKITTAVATDRKTLKQGVVALKSDTTKNDQQGEDAYENIEVLLDLQQVLLPQLKSLNETIKPSSTDKGDAFSALVVAMTIIANECKHLKYEKTISLVTNGLGHFDAEDLEQIALQLKRENIRLTVLGVDFDDADYGFKEEDKSFQKKENEASLKKLAEQCGGVFATLAEAVSELGEPRLKETRPVPSYRGRLTLGDPSLGADGLPDTSISIDVERYPRTMVRRPPTASKFVVKRSGDKDSGDMDLDESNGQANVGGLEAVRNTIKYFLPEKDEFGNALEVERDQLARGYEYGRTAVHISESDEGVTKLETTAGLEVIGFIPWENFDRYMTMSTTNVIIAPRSNSKSTMALSSLIHALHEYESFAVVKLVTKEGKDPVIEILAPHIEAGFECLIDVHLPFAEDVRSYKFPPLDEVRTVSGKTLKQHRYLPNDDLQEAMDEYVDAMDLSTFGLYDDNKPTEYAKMSETFSPVLHRIDQAIRWRAVHPEEPIPPPYDILTRFSNPPEELQRSAKEQLEALVAASDVKKVPPKVAGRRKRETIKPLSGLDVDALLGGSGDGVHIDPDNALVSFKRVLENPPPGVSDPDVVIPEATQQFLAIIEKRIRSFGGAELGMAQQELKVMRDELIAMEAEGLWNDTIKALKKKLLSGELGDGSGDAWFKIRTGDIDLGLVQGKIPGGGQVTEQEAKEFLSGSASKEVPIR